jgi:CheY-like chemotaxis protein
MTQDEDRLFGAVKRLCEQVGRLAENQIRLAQLLADGHDHHHSSHHNQQQQQHQKQTAQLSIVHFPSPSIIDSQIIESPFIFPEHQLANHTESTSTTSTTSERLMLTVSPSAFSRQGPAPRVLIVEDDPLFQHLFSALLHPLNLDISIASTAHDALLLHHRHHPFSLIFMDVKMPGGMDGLEATAAIRRVDKVTPIVTVSAWAGREEREEAMRAGANECVGKPVTGEQLAFLVQKYSSLGSCRRLKI